MLPPDSVLHGEFFKSYTAFSANFKFLIDEVLRNADAAVFHSDTAVIKGQAVHQHISIGTFC